MMRNLSELSEQEQDNLFYMALERVTNTAMQDLLSMLYLSPLSGSDILVRFQNCEFASHPIFRLRDFGLNIKLKGGKYHLLGIDDGIDCNAMRFSNKYAPNIKLREI